MVRIIKGKNDIFIFNDVDELGLMVKVSKLIDRQ